MELPKQVKIGWRVFRIEAFDPLEAIGKDRYGECNKVSGVIRVDTVHGARQSAETLLHEILHAMFSIFRMREKDDEEDIVQTASHGLASIWVDNPDVMAWIAARLTDS